MAGGRYDLHLRAADLRHDDAVRLAATLVPGLRSFSISYNAGVTDAGAVALIEALPKGVTEIGMVECDLGDMAGRALVAWVAQARGLRLICVEGNGFSPVVQTQIRQVGGRAGAMVVV